MIIYVSWHDKRHLTLRSSIFPNGAKCYHYENESIAESKVTSYLAKMDLEGFSAAKVANGEWVLTK